MMNAKRALLWYPLGLLIVLLLLDKLALIPTLHRHGRKPTTPLENVVLNVHNQDWSAGKRPRVVFFGTSRSESFRHLHPLSVNAAANVAAEDKKFLNSLEFRTNTILRASEFLVQYLMIRGLTARDANMDLAVLEFSPEMMNRNSPFSVDLYLRNEVHDPDTLLDMRELLPEDLGSEVELRLLFSTYASNFRPELALQNYLADEDYVAKARVPLLALKLHPQLEALRDDYADYPEDTQKMPPEVYADRFVKYTKHLREESILRNYKYEPAERRLLLATIDALRKADIPVVVWRPRAHPMVEAELKKSEFYKHYADIKADIAKRGAAFYDANADFQCLRYADSSHLSAKCYPALAVEILKAAAPAAPRIKAAL